MKIKNIAIDEIDSKFTYEMLFAIQNAVEFQESKDCYEIGDVYSLHFGFIKDVQVELETNDFDLNKQIEYLKKITDKKLYLYETVLTCNYLVSNIVKLLENENKLLSSTPTSEEIEAGIESFSELGVFSQFRTLANNDITKIEEIRKIKYEDCFLELYARKKESEFEKKINDIYRRKK